MNVYFVKRLMLACFLWLLPGVACVSAADKVTMLGGPLFESCPMMLMAEEDAFASLGLRSTFVPWQSPDQYLAMVVSAQADFVVLSTLEYARLSRRIDGLELLFTVTGSPLWLLGRAAGIALPDLKGATIALPFRGGMPERTLAMLLRNAPVAMGDMRIVSAGGAVTSAQLVMMGQADYALVPEPVAAMMVAASRDRMDTHEMCYALDMEAAWREVYPDGPQLLLSHIVALNAPEKTRRLFREQYDKYAVRCRQNPEAAVPLFRKYFPVLPPDSIDALLTTGRERIYDATDKQQELHRFMQLMEQVGNETR